MRLILSRHIPHFRRVLLVESGSRHLYENLLSGWYSAHSAVIERVDLVTCFAGEPSGFDSGKGHVYRVFEYQGGEARGRLYAQLRRNRYDIVGMICSGEDIMTKWKWILAWKLPAKVFILNENGDYFWFDFGQWRTIRHFILYRAGLSGPDAVGTIGRLIAFPFTLTYLILFAAWVHLKRRVRA